MLSFFEDVLDRMDVMAVTVFAAVFVGEGVVDVKKGVALETDVDKCRLHAGQDVFNSALVDVAYDPLILLALNVKLDQRRSSRSARASRRDRR